MRTRLLILPVAVVAMVALSVPSSADHATRTIKGPLEPVADSPHIVPITGNLSTDIAFWGDRLYGGLYLNGFRILDISNPAAPVEVLQYEDCAGTQGDMLVWQNLLMRMRDSAAGAGQTCDGEPVPPTFEGLQIFDVSNEANPDLLTMVESPSGAHTASLVPDLANNRLIVYSSPSGAGGIDITQVPLNNPAAATFIRNEPAGRNCHDTAVFLGDVNRALCAGGNGFTMFSLDPADGGSLTNPAELYTKSVTSVTVGHAVSFAWDGKMFAFGHEPGGGVDDRCDEQDREVERTQFFYDTETGNLLGTWVLETKQAPNVENCTVHNFNFIPTTNGRDIIVGGHYQAGTWVVDVTDPAKPFTIAFADPPPLDPNLLIDGGAWSSYWYDGYIYESEQTKGVHVFRLNIPETAPGRYRPEAFSNPQTQMESIRLPKCRGLEGTLAGTSGSDRINGTSLDDVIVGRGGHDRINGKGGNDVICGNGGSDKLRGAKGHDLLLGQGGSDSLNGGPGTARGLPGQDACVGGKGRDRAAKSCEVTRSI